MKTTDRVPFYTIPDNETLNQEISASHDRCREYGVNPGQTLNRNQVRLNSQGLSLRLKENRDFLSIAISQIEELYQFVAGADFVVNLADKQGYILHIIGDPPLLEKMAASNCWPGYRWTEKDVGTSAISLALARRMPVQINDNEHYCERGHGHTCSASPVFDPDHQLIGIIAMSGDATRVHPHTLGMVITAARAIETQLRIQTASKELRLHNHYMRALIDSIDSGVMAVDQNGHISQINNQGRQILQWEKSLVNAPLNDIFGDRVRLERLKQPGFEFVDREVFIRSSRRTIQLLATIKPIFGASGTIKGFIVVFNEIKRIRKLFNQMAGTQARFTFENIIGISPAIQEAKRLAMISALSKSTVLLLGETGTGKELFAQAIHNHSSRRGHPFLAINCGAIPRELLESELFGYAEGSFTGASKGGRPGKFELADGGTVLLDEIGDMSADMQVKLLRVLQTGEVYRIGEHTPISVDIRIIAATHVQLKQAVVDGSFRDDLFYRLNVFPIIIPPLRERPEDIIPLFRHFLNRCTSALEKPSMVFDEAAEQELVKNIWLGNVRELENAVERAVNLSDDSIISADILGIPPGKPKRMAYNGGKGSLQDIEKNVITSAIEQTGFNLAKASRTLGISRATLYNKIKKYNLPVQRNSV